MNKISELQVAHNVTLKLSKNILDCEHRMFHLMAKKMFDAKNIISEIHLFPKYDGEHTNFLNV